MELTLAIVKPDSVKAGNTGKILAHLEERGFAIRGVRMLHLSEAQARPSMTSTRSARSSASWSSS